MASPRALVLETVAAIRATVTERPTVGVVLGSGLGEFAGELKGPKLDFASLPHMPQVAVHGHAGMLCFGEVAGVCVAALQGRAHGYEGHDAATTVHGVRTLAGLGCHTVVLTNAAGCLVPEWAPGEFMLVTDHLNLTGRNPLVGPHDPELGARFPDMSRAYDEGVRGALLAAARETGRTLREGTYAGVLGPSYETPAEVRMLKAMGADAVGMSTVLEVIALHHSGVRVGAVSCLTNHAAGVSEKPLSHDEVESVGRASAPALVALLKAALGRLRESPDPESVNRW